MWRLLNSLFLSFGKPVPKCTSNVFWVLKIHVKDTKKKKNYRIKILTASWHLSRHLLINWATGFLNGFFYFNQWWLGMSLYLCIRIPKGIKVIFYSHLKENRHAYYEATATLSTQGFVSSYYSFIIEACYYEKNPAAINYSNQGILL